MALFGGRKKGGSAPESPHGGKAGSGDGVPSDDAPLQFGEKDIAAARKWFQQAKKLSEDRNYDYAIESYLTGLKFWPEAVEEGHQPLRAAAFARRETGGKKPGTMEGMKHAMSGKDSVQAMLNAEWLYARDPLNISYMEGIVKNAAKAKCEATLLFIAPIYFDAAKNEKKLSKDRFVVLRRAYGEAGERCERRGDVKRALHFYQGALTVLEVLRQVGGTTLEYGEDLKNLATKVTILKGKYDSSEDFRGSVKDSGAQRDIHDRERMVMDDARMDQLVEEARQTWKANPGVSAKLLQLVELLCRGEAKDHEDEALRLLDAEYAATKNYGFKSRADDIRMKHLRRNVRQCAAGGDKEATRQAQLEQLKLELKTYKERVEQYPTDNKLKFEYGRRLVLSKKYDEAIPVLQEARNDPKNRAACMGLIGRSFFEKGYHTQAMTTYRQAIAEHELVGDELAKELYYWLGRACEACGKKEEAEKAYGQVIQWDYNYKDVRERLDRLEE